MTIEINSFLGGISNSICSASGLNKIFSSVFSLSLVLTIAILIMIMILYPTKQNSTMWSLFRLFLYVLITIVTTLSIHNSFIKNKYKEQYSKQNVDVFMKNIHGGNVYESEKVEVNPQFVENEEPTQSVDELLEELNSSITK